LKWSKKICKNPLEIRTLKIAAGFVKDGVKLQSIGLQECIRNSSKKQES